MIETYPFEKHYHVRRQMAAARRIRVFPVVPRKPPAPKPADFVPYRLYGKTSMRPIPKTQLHKYNEWDDAISLKVKR